MKSTGIVRKIDNLGRVVLPIELRRTLDIQVGDALEIFVSGDGIILRKPRSVCVFCGGGEGLLTFRDKAVCETCRSELSRSTAEV